ncbi:ABC transporter substrate binding protein [Bacteroides sp.]|uniref:sensor histidine kinase n=1 Tax=Bacteroides sp. TaxID=29523 RepID=UPI00260A737C|nr:ABC transporter substrate binding protein [Bacteroides sp.]MDD3037877.1 ABC transporter substrate binding protein [Bacteroides sp.]
MNRRNYCLFVVLLFIIFNRALATEQTYKILFIQSYTSQTPWSGDLTSGLAKGFKDSGLKVDITTEYLDADFWAFKSEKVIMRRICERAREKRIDLIVTVSDEAFYTLFSCGDSLSSQIPVVFFGIKYPDEELIASHPNVCGYTSNPDFAVILQQAKKVFPQRKEVICVIDNSFLSNKGREDFKNEWEIFYSENPDYKMKIYNTQQETTNHIISAICYPRNSYSSIVIAPKWSPFLSFVGKNSKAPVFSCQNVGLTNGVFVAYDADAFESAHLTAQKASRVLQGESPSSLGTSDLDQEFIHDYRQLEYFHVSQNRIPPGGVIVNQPYWEKYKLLFILLYSSILILLIGSVVWLVRVNRRESRRRVHAQTRLLVQNKLVEQRNEFDNIFHSIRDGVITYDTDLNIHFTNRSLLQMLHLPHETLARPYEGMVAGSLFKIFYDGEEILRKMLHQVVETGNRVVIPKGAFMKEVHTENYFPVSGEIVPIRSKEQITGMALSARNVSDEEMQKRFFDMALEESFIYPWQFDVASNSFIFPQGFLVHFGYDDSVTTISRDEMDRMIHPDDLVEMSSIFDKALAGDESSARLNFRQRNATGEYEWWEYRSSVITGLTSGSFYNILGICQSIQRYKVAEQEMREARDKALQADKLKSAFLANMSHEIRTPLNAIVGFSDLLSDTSLFSAEEVAQFIATINKNCGLLLALINDILDLSRIESGTMEFQFSNHNLSLLLKTVHDSQRLNMPQNVELVLHMPEVDKKYLVTDNVRLQQVINNLINNAAKFTTSGFITFGYEEDADPDYTLLYVEDTGVGITQEGIDHIFERFYKVDNFTQGAGLGLSICQTIVERLRGTISVTSEVGKGTRFTVRIPNSCE